MVTTTSRHVRRLRDSAWGSMDRTADLDTALSFEVGRIEEQATLSGQPLTKEQRLLLNDLPPATPAIWFPDPIPPPLVPCNAKVFSVAVLCEFAVKHCNQGLTFSRWLDTSFAHDIGCGQRLAVQAVVRVI